MSEGRQQTGQLSLFHRKMKKEDENSEDGQQQTGQLSMFHRSLKKGDEEKKAQGNQMSQVRFGVPATAKTGTTSSTTADTLSHIREGVKTLFQDTQASAGTEKAPLSDRMSQVRFGSAATAKTTASQSAPAGSVSDTLARIRESMTKNPPDQSPLADTEKKALSNRMSRVRFGRPATEPEISAQDIDGLRLWSNITDIEIEFLARNDNLKRVQDRVNILALKQEQEAERARAVGRAEGNEFAQSDPVQSVYHKDQGIQGYYQSDKNPDTLAYPRHTLPEIENQYTPFKGFLQQRYEEALKGASQSKVLGKEWAGYTALQTALLAPAYLEEIASGLLNAPNKAAIAGQHAARFRLTGDNDDLDKAAGTFALAALEASPLTGLKTVVGKASQVYNSARMARTPRTPLHVGKNVVEKAVKTEVSNGYSFSLDNLNRVTKIYGRLVSNPAQKRNAKMQFNAGGEYRLFDDEGGHFIARRFNGPTENYNHFAQNRNFNRGQYKILENEWQRALDNGFAVYVEITPNYIGNSLRPHSLAVEYTIDGIAKRRMFTNQAGG